MRFVVAFAVAVLAAGFALPAAADPLVDGLAKCATIKDNLTRLSCYDALNPAMNSAAPGTDQPFVAVPTPAGTPPTGSPSVAVNNPPPFDPYRKLGVPPTEQIKPDQFGGEHLAPPAPPPPPPGQQPPASAPAEPQTVDTITVGVVDYSYNPYDKFLVILENGQIWQQIESDSGKARFEKGGKNTVTISRGFIGSYNLQINDGSAVYKVKRLK